MALRAGHAEIPENFGLGVTSLLLADEHHSPAAKAREAAHDGMIVGKGAVTVELVKFIENLVHVIEGIRPQRMTA